MSDFLCFLFYVHNLHTFIIAIIHYLCPKWSPNVVVFDLVLLKASLSNNYHYRLRSNTYNHNPLSLSRTQSSGSDQLAYNHLEARSSQKYKILAQAAARKIDPAIRRINEESIENYGQRPRAGSLSSYFMRNIKIKDHPPRMEETEEFWNKYRRRSTHFQSFRILMKQILFQ